jgi:glutamine phosphoribosylpyrophosphate amidotransferase
LSTPTRFNKKNDTYFIKIDDKPAIEIKNSQSLISIFEKYSNSIETYIDKENLSYKRVEDLKKIVNYYNTL